MRNMIPVFQFILRDAQLGEQFFFNFDGKSLRVLGSYKLPNSKANHSKGYFGS